MNSISMNKALLDMQSMQAQAQSRPLPAMNMDGAGLDGGINKVNAPAQGEFGQLLATAINGANATLMNTGDMAKRYEQGDASVSLVEVMVAAQKSKVAFTAVTEVRNKMLTAYQDIMNMPI